MAARLRHVAHYMLAAALYYSGALALRCWLRRCVSRRPEVAVLGLHRILTAEQALLTCSEEGMIVTLPTFRKLLQMLRQQYQVLSLEEFLGGNISRSSKPSCLLTFDDAWLDTFENAYPALREAGVPAAVFVPTGLVGGDSYFWVERLSMLWKNSGEYRGALSIALGKELALAPLATLEKSIIALKRVPYARRESIIKELITQFSDGSQPGRTDRFMSWEQLLSMSAVIEAASHTVNHVLLDFEEKAGAETELRQSRETLEEKLGRPVRALAYPSGNFDERVRGWVASAGYHWAFTVRPGTYRKGDDPLTVPRSLLQEGNITSPWGIFSPAMFHLRLTGWR